ncbi:MAG: hypothetical protein COV69_00755 [Parcubacteria group bacterium CG11_big_fil_rev_8_21_14_0_20_39_14]|nr:MAG: hypothetical protein COV69_00755 [Parcubacteria group bacterium CG11_big_fil_rev_8_21_14_0_20_39_14]
MMPYFWSDLIVKENGVEKLTQSLGRELLSLVQKEANSIWKPFYWKQLPLVWLGKNEILRERLLEFISDYSTLSSREEKLKHFKTCFFASPRNELFAILKFIFLLEKLPFLKNAPVFIIDSSVREASKHFIVGNSEREILKTVKKLEKEGASGNFDILGEEVLNEVKADANLKEYLSLLKITNVEVSLKPSALNYNLVRLRDVFRAGHCGVTIDIEQYNSRDLIFEMFKKVLDEDEFKDNKQAGIAFQTYLKDWEDSLIELLNWVKRRKSPIKIRLVKGAYWDSEVNNALKEGRPIPVFTKKRQTDLAFERACQLLMENHNIVRIAVASHNVRSVAKAMALANVLNIPKEEIEFQVLYGMGHPLMKGIVKMGYSVKVYVPVGELITGMSFLVRRIIENTSQGSFVFQSFGSKASVEELLKNPVEEV